MLTGYAVATSKMEKKENGPTLFPWNRGSYFDFRDPNAISRYMNNVL